jgi:hypothetical protein
MKLTDAKIERSGVTARTWNFETTDVRLETAGAATCLLFKLKSKGGGVTEVRLTIGPKDFAALAENLVKVDRGAAMGAMAARLAAEIARQGEAERAVARKARESVVEAANEAYQSAPSGRDHAQRLVMEEVRTLVNKLNSPAQPDAESAAE